MVIGSKDVTIGFDATTQEEIHVNSIHFTTENECVAAAVDELAGGTAEDYAQHICEMVDNLSACCNMIKLWKETARTGARGHDLKIYPQHTRSQQQRKKSFVPRSVQRWNNLPEHVVGAKSVNSFKNRLDKFWSDHPIKYDDYRADLLHARGSGQQHKIHDISESDEEDPTGTCIGKHLNLNLSNLK